jgi:hypothetical protein
LAEVAFYESRRKLGARYLASFGAAMERVCGDPKQFRLHAKDFVGQRFFLAEIHRAHRADRTRHVLRRNSSHDAFPSGSLPEGELGLPMSAQPQDLKVFIFES